MTGETEVRTTGRGPHALYTAVAFSAWTVVISGLLVAALALFLWRPWADASRDPRADPGTRRDIPLSKALHLSGHHIPQEAADVHYFADGNMMGTIVRLTYRIPCTAVPAVLTDAEATAPIALDDPEISGLLPFAGRHGWRPDGVPTYARENPEAGTSIVMVATESNGGCTVFLEHFA